MKQIYAQRKFVSVNIRMGLRLVDYEVEIEFLKFVQNSKILYFCIMLICQILVLQIFWQDNRNLRFDSRYIFIGGHIVFK